MPVAGGGGDGGGGGLGVEDLVGAMEEERVVAVDSEEANSRKVTTTKCLRWAFH